MTKQLLAAIAFALLLLLGCGGQGNAPPAQEVITEDDPRWDCATMGNRICGPTTTVLDARPAPPHPPEYICHWEDKGYVCQDPASGAWVIY